MNFLSLLRRMNEEVRRSFPCVIPLEGLKVLKDIREEQKKKKKGKRSQEGHDDCVESE